MFKKISTIIIMVAMIASMTACDGETIENAIESTTRDPIITSAITETTVVPSTETTNSEMTDKTVDPEVSETTVVTTETSDNINKEFDATESSSSSDSGSHTHVAEGEDTRRIEAVAHVSKITVTSNKDYSMVDVEIYFHCHEYELNSKYVGSIKAESAVASLEVGDEVIVVIEEHFNKDTNETTGRHITSFKLQRNGK